MTFPLRLWALTALLVAALVPATSAAQTNGYYVSLSGLYVIPTDSDLSANISGFTASTDLSMDSGIGFLAAFGYGADVGLRGEIEFGYRKTDFDKLDGLTVTGNGVNESLSGQLPFDGDATTLSLMANGIYAFDAGKLRPYVGVGIGLARHDASSPDLAVTLGGTAFELEGSSEDDIVFAYQGIAGVSLPISESTEARLGYRYFATGDGDFEGVEASYGTHNFEAGILFRF